MNPERYVLRSPCDPRAGVHVSQVRVGQPMQSAAFSVPSFQVGHSSRLPAHIHLQQQPFASPGGPSYTHAPGGSAFSSGVWSSMPGASPLLSNAPSQMATRPQVQVLPYQQQLQPANLGQLGQQVLYPPSQQHPPVAYQPHHIMVQPQNGASHTGHSAAVQHDLRHPAAQPSKGQHDVGLSAAQPRSAGHAGHSPVDTAGGWARNFWHIRKIEERPLSMMACGFTAYITCFLVIGLSLLLRAPLLDPRPKDIVPVILRDHPAKRKQDAGKSLAETALACPGCDDLKERSERMFYLHLIYEIDDPSKSLWDDVILKRIYDIEKKVYEAKGRGPDGNLWGYKDLCLIATPDPRLEAVGRQVPTKPGCAMAVSPLLFLADTMLPLSDPPPFKLRTVWRQGFLWINESHHAWTDPMTRCVVPSDQDQKRSMESLSNSFLRNVAMDMYDKDYLKDDPNKELVDSWCSKAASSLPKEMANCGCLALIYNSVQLAIAWDVSLQRMWNFDSQFDNLLGKNSAEFVEELSRYWAAYDDDSVDLCRRNSKSCLWRGSGDKRQPWKNKQCKDSFHMSPRRRSRILENPVCGDLTGDYAAHAFYARRRVMNNVAPHPFVMAVPAPDYTTVPADTSAVPEKPELCDKRMIQRRRWGGGSCYCRRRNSPRDLPSGFECVGKEVKFTGSKLDKTELVMLPKKFPNLFSMVADDDFGECLNWQKGVCMERSEQVKALHSLFFIGLPLRNVNPAWTGLTAEKGRAEASEFLMEWIFQTYHDMLVEENAKTPGFSITFDANSLQNGNPLLKQYIAYSIPSDAKWITGSVLFMLAFITWSTGSIFLGVGVIAKIVLAFGPALILYSVILQQRYIGLLHMNGLFIILGVGVDDAFVILDAYGQEKAEAAAEGRSQNFGTVMSHAAGHAAKACFCTSVTTFFAFSSNAFSQFPSISTFGTLCACLILVNFVTDFSLFLAIVCLDDRRKATNTRSAESGMQSREISLAQSRGDGDEVDALRPMEKWFHDRFFHFVRMSKLPILVVFALSASLCMWTASYATTDPNMPKVFPPSDNYERFLPSLANRFGKAFNPFRLKVRVHIGIKASDPIDRGSTPTYNDCFFNCAGQKPNFVDVFTNKDGDQMKVQQAVVELCDYFQGASRFDGTDDDMRRAQPRQREALGLQIASEHELGDTPAVKCPLKDFQRWTQLRQAATQYKRNKTNGTEFPSPHFCCQNDSDFVTFLQDPLLPDNKMFQTGSRNMEHFQDAVFFDRVDGHLMLRALVIEVQLKTSWQTPYKEGIRLYKLWEKFLVGYASDVAEFRGLHGFPDAVFATDMFAFHWFFVQEALNWEVYSGIALSLLLTFIILIAATGNVYVAGISVSCIITIVSSVLAFAVCMDWKTSVSEAIIYVMIIGLSVDYVIHLGDAYLECPDTSNDDRVQFMLTRMGVSVISGAFSSAGAAVFMLFCKSLFLVKFGMVLCFVVSISVLTALVVFPALLLVAGPSGQNGSVAELADKLRAWLAGIDFESMPARMPWRRQEPRPQPRLYGSVMRHRRSTARRSQIATVEMQDMLSSAQPATTARKSRKSVAFAADQMSGSTSTDPSDGFAASSAGGQSEGADQAGKAEALPAGAEIAKIQDTGASAKPANTTRRSRKSVVFAADQMSESVAGSTTPAETGGASGKASVHEDMATEELKGEMENRKSLFDLSSLRGPEHVSSPQRAYQESDSDDAEVFDLRSLQTT